MESGVLVVIIFSWIGASFAVATIGSDRKIGFGVTFFISLILSPIIGALIAIASERISKEPIVANQSTKADQLVASSTENAKKGQYEDAIKDLLSAISLNPKHKNAYYNLACFSSRLERTGDAIRFLANAIEHGYSSFDKIQSDPDLVFLRSQPEFTRLVSDGYRILNANDIKTNVVEQLERLAALRDRGVLTEAEFVEQKKRIIS